jgi:hypothetical protein
METATTFVDQSPIPPVNPSPILQPTPIESDTLIIVSHQTPTPPPAGETILLQPTTQTIDLLDNETPSPSPPHNLATATTTTTVTTTAVTTTNIVHDATHLLPDIIREINNR